MEPVFLDMAQMENYQYDSYSTYADQYSYNSPEYSSLQPYAQSGYNYYQYPNVADHSVYPDASEQDAVILLSSDQQPESTFQSLSNTSVMSFKTEAEMLNYLSSFGDLNNIQILPVVDEVENTEKYIEQAPDQQVPAEVKELEPVLPNPSGQAVQRKSLKTKTKCPRTRLVYENSSFVCEPCGRTFGRRSSLRQHNNVHHSGPREHRCETCGKRFHTGDDLRRHEQRHVALQKPHSCAECSRQFNYQQDLERHIAVRHGVAKFACQHCDKRIARRDHLLSHEATHTRRPQLGKRRNRFQELAQQKQ